MIQKSQIFNFDAYSDFSKLLKGKIFNFPLNEKTVSKVKNKDKAKVITVKSTSEINYPALKNFPNLSLLVTRTVGMDHINLTDCKKAGIRVKNIPEYGAFAVAEHAFALLLALSRKILILNKETQKGRFSFQNGKGITLEGKTLGVVGAGRVGIETIKLGIAFKMKVLAFDMFKNNNLAKKIGFSYVSLKELLKKSDVISLNIPLTENTKYLISGKEISLMKKNVILINTSRGAIVDTKALIKNIKKFKYLGLDVLEKEENFDEKNPLLAYENVLITPHCAFFTDKTTSAIAQKTKKIIEDYFA